MVVKSEFILQNNMSENTLFIERLQLNFHDMYQAFRHFHKHRVLRLTPEGRIRAQSLAKNPPEADIQFQAKIVTPQTKKPVAV